LDPGVGLLTILPPNPTITFTSTDPHLPLPNPEYLGLHAAVCRVAHLSGAAGYLDLEDQEVERLGVLARDGSSADFLTSRLRCGAHGVGGGSGHPAVRLELESVRRDCLLRHLAVVSLAF